MAAGDTIWVAGGSYSQQLQPAKTGTSGARITVARARSDAAACTGAAGWNASFDSLITQNDAGIVFSGNFDYITISGRTTAAGGTHGWIIDFAGSTAGIGINFPNGAGNDNIICEYMDLKGPGEVTYTNDGRGIDDTPFSSAANHTFSHMKIYNWETGIIIVGTGGNTICEYIEMYDLMAVNWPTFHPNGIYTSQSPNGIVRYCIFRKGPNGNGVGEGVFFEQVGGSTDWQIYGNLFYDLDQSGMKAIEITSNVGAIKVFNNTFVNILTGSLYTSNNPSAPGGEWRNNLNYLSSNGTIGTASNNLVASSSSVFVNFVAKKFSYR